MSNRVHAPILEFETTSASSPHSELAISELMTTTPDIVYYFEEGVRGNVTCIALSRYEVFANTTSSLTHSDEFCLPQGDECAHSEPVMIANDRYLIVCFDLIHKDNDYCLFARFDHGNGDRIDMSFDVNDAQPTLFSHVKLSVQNLKSFAFVGHQLFGVDVAQSMLCRWDVSDKDNNFSFERIELGVISDDLDEDDEVYPVRLEARHGCLYLFQRFEQSQAVEVSKISYLNRTIRETGVGWLYDQGHESLFDDFGKIHGFVFDESMQQYFMFSDVEMIVSNDDSAMNAATFHLNSDFKFMCEADGNWSSFYDIKIPIVTHNDTAQVAGSPFVFGDQGKMAYFDGRRNENESQWILRVEYTENFVFFPIPLKEHQDSLYFMQLLDVDLERGSVTVAFHPLVAAERRLQGMTGASLMLVVSGRDGATQSVLGGKSQIVKKYGHLAY